MQPIKITVLQVEPYESRNVQITLITSRPVLKNHKKQSGNKEIDPTRNVFTFYHTLNRQVITTQKNGSNILIAMIQSVDNG